MTRTRTLLVATVVTAGLAGLVPASTAEEPDACTDPDASGLDPACLPGGTVGQFHRQVCDYQWVEERCADTALSDPGYATGTEPTPGAPLALRVGAVHNHSGYSDGDPTAVPRDYFVAARTGHNQADAGGDTGVILDFLWSSEHSDNTQIPITTSAACLESPEGFVSCGHFVESHHYWKWPATLRQAREESTGEFTAIRGFEWTNDYYNHMNVYFSTNFRNVKIDGSYLSMDIMWDWLERPVNEGGGADGLVTFNHPGGDPALTPFDGGQPHNQLLSTLFDNGNWNNLAYVPAAEDNVAGIEVNGGDDIEWYVKALENGWHLGPVAAEDEHQREWATSADGKTLILTRGNTPQHYYWAFQQQRTVAIKAVLVGGSPGTKATFPTIRFFADGTSVQDAATLLGSATSAGGAHDLVVDLAGLEEGMRVALVSNTGGAQANPVALGQVAADGTFTHTEAVTAPASGEDWYFVVVCEATDPDCGGNQNHLAVTAPIWVPAA